VYTRSKPHACLTLPQRHEAFAALHFAEHIGLPINASITIHWALAGGNGTWRSRQSRILDLLRRCLAHHGSTSIPYVWTAEQSPQGKDVHSHMAIHLPLNFSLARLDCYLRTLLDSDDPQVLKVDLCANHARGAEGWIVYMCKALEPEHLDLVPKGLRQRHGTVVGARFGVAHCIGRTARSHHFDCMRTFDKQRAQSEQDQWPMSS
jgi:hypothetical protein